MSDDHLDPARKHDFAFLFDVRDGNPNGDPDSGGMPRTDPETGHGLVTDVAIKRKVRNMVALLQEGVAGYDIYVESGVALNAQHERAYAALSLDPKRRRESEAEARQWMCETFFDVRMFGAVMTTGTKPCGRVQGPLQLTFSRSIDPVLPQEHIITRITQTRQDDIDRGETTELGTKYVIPYGLYLGYGHFSAPLARRTGVRSEDLEVFWSALMLAFDHDRAASRGKMALRGLYIFSHDNALGRAPAYQLLERIQPAQRAGVVAPRSFADYTVSLGADSPEGVVLTCLVR